MRWLRWGIGAAVLLVALWAGYWLMATHLLGQALTDCSNDVLQETPSTDEQLVATAFERSCGATSPFVRIVSVRARETPFRADDRETWVFVIEGRPDLDVAWAARRSLTIKYGGGGRVVREATVWYGVTVSYE